VLPMLRVWPPTTMTRQRSEVFFSSAVKFVLKSLDARSELRKPGKPWVRFLEFANLERWRSPDRLPATNRLAGRDSGLRTCNGPILKHAMVGDSDLPVDDDVTTDDTGAGNSRLRSDHGLRANLYIVSYMDQII